MAKSIGDKFPLTKLALTFAQYSTTVVLTQSRPLPDLCRLISATDLQSLGRDAEKVSVKHVMGTLFHVHHVWCFHLTTLPVPTPPNGVGIGSGVKSKRQTANH